VDNSSSRRDGTEPVRGRSGPRPDLEVYPPREDSFLLLPFAEPGPGTTLAEVGAGSGLASVHAARGGARVVATDLNRTALRGLRESARRDGLEIEVVRTDLMSGLGRFDRVLLNPPYLPTGPTARDPDRGTRLALDGGPDGCRVLARFLEDLGRHLAAGASAYVVVSSVQDARARRRILARWAKRRGRVETVAARRLEGELLEVLRFWRPTPAARRSRRSPRGTAGRRRTPRSIRSASNPASGPGRTRARGAASTRRRSPRGS